MIEIQTYKNGKLFKIKLTDETNLDKDFQKVHDRVGGMWNGVDVFEIKINKGITQFVKY